jgi:glycosyltransferase involved in cell wall biosynthesis
MKIATKIDTISIALCTYNGSEYLPQLLESYVSQTHQPDEVVVCDDCSSDDTVAILRHFACSAPFAVQIIVNDRNIGSTKNFERAISICSGDVIFLSDQDDVWKAKKVEKIYREFINDPKVGMVFTDAELVDERLDTIEDSILNGRVQYVSLTKEEKSLIDEGNLFLVLIKRNVVTGATMALRSKYKNAVMPFPDDVPGLIHDGWIAIMMSIMARSVLINEPLIKYRQHGGQQVGMSNFVHTTIKTPWKDAMERTASKYNKEKEYFELLRNHVTKRIEPPEKVLDTINKIICHKRDSADHYSFRKSLPDNVAGKAVSILGQLLRGRYHRFSNGFRSAVRDLLVDREMEIEFHEMVDKRRIATG